MSLKTVAIFALDVNCSSASLALSIDVCRRAVEMAMLLAPADEVGLVVAGSSDSFNPLHRSGETARFANISVVCDIAVPTVDFFDHLKRSTLQPNEPHVVDFLDTLIVCDHLMHERTRGKRYQRIVYLLTDACTEVVYKTDMEALLQSYLEHNISLVVVGIDFSESLTDASCAGDDAGDGGLGDLADLPVKAQNEQVLRAMCTALGEGSIVLPLEETLREVAKPRRRKVALRPQKVVLSIGDVRLATQLLTKTRVEQLSTLLHVTTAQHGGRDAYGANNAPIGDDDDDNDDDDDETKRKNGAAAAEPFQEKKMIRGYRLGGNFIPCTTSMRIIGPKALDAIAVVPLQQVPVYVLMGDGVKVMMPLANDMVGAKAFRSIVRAMAAERKAMIVRFVRASNADPMLGLCVPSSNERRDVFFFSRLPFSDDVRHLQFSGCQEACHCDNEQQSDEEERLVESIVEDMTVCKSVLRPHNTFNPVIQGYYALLRRKLRRHVDTKETRCQELQCGGDEDEEEEEDEGVMSLLHHLHGSFTASNLQEDQHDPFACVREKLEMCSDMFAYVSSDKTNVQGSTRATSTTAATVERLGSVSSLATIAAPFFASTAFDTMTSDPTKTTCEVAKLDDTAKTHPAADGLVDVIFKLFLSNIKDGEHDTCGDSVSVLRKHCVAEGIPEFFNSFVMKLQLVSLESGHEIPSHFDLRPITQQECAGSMPGPCRFTHLPLAHNSSVLFPEPGGDVEKSGFSIVH